MPHKPGTGAIFGIVSEDGVVKSSSPVILIDPRRDADAKQRIIGRQLTAANGGFEFAGLDEGYTDYLLMATDEDGAEPKNALVQDRVQPIAAHSGAGALSNWYVNAGKDGMIGAIIGFPTAETPDNVLGFDGRVHLVGSTTADELVTVPEIPAMTGVHIRADGYIISPCKHFLNAPRNKALEFVIDFDSIEPTGSGVYIQFGGWYANTSSNSADAFYWGGIGAGEAHNFLEVIISADGTTLDVWHNNTSTDSYHSNQSNLVITADVTALVGLTHMVVVFESATAISLYADGTLHTSGSTTINDDWTFTSATQEVPQLSLGGSPVTNDLKGGEYVISLAAAYNRALSASQVTAHYKALWNNDLQNTLTGVGHELAKHFPTLYWRFIEFETTIKYTPAELSWRDSVTLESEQATRLIFSGISTDVDATALSPIAGRNALAWLGSNGSFSNDTAACNGFVFENQFSAHCWVYFDNATPAGDEDVVSIFKPRASTEVFFQVKRKANGNLEISYATNAQVIVVDTAHVIANSEWVEIFVVVDKTVSGSEKYEVWVGTETTAPAIVSTAATNADPLFNVEHLAGQLTFGTRTVTIGSGSFAGRICEVALLPLALTATEIADIWAAKDVV